MNELKKSDFSERKRQGRGTGKGGRRIGIVLRRLTRKKGGKRGERAVPRPSIPKHISDRTRPKGGPPSSYGRAEPPCKNRPSFGHSLLSVITVRNDADSHPLPILPNHAAVIPCPSSSSTTSVPPRCPPPLHFSLVCTARSPVTCRSGLVSVWQAGVIRWNLKLRIWHCRLGTW